MLKQTLAKNLLGKGYALMKSKKVLLVEDNSVVAFVLKETLADIDDGVEIRVVYSGEEAQKWITEGKWDMIVTDYSLPGISGLELMRDVTKTKKQPPWVMITAFGSTELEEEAKRMGAMDYMTKPFPLDHLRQLVASGLGY